MIELVGSRASRGALEVLDVGSKERRSTPALDLGVALVGLCLVAVTTSRSTYRVDGLLYWGDSMMGCSSGVETHRSSDKELLSQRT